MDEYCKKHCINSYVYINDYSVFHTSQIFASNCSIQKNQVSNQEKVKFSVQESSDSMDYQSFVKIRSPIDKGFRFTEKKFRLTDFLSNSNQIINNMSTYNTISSNYLQATFGSNFSSFSSMENNSCGSIHQPLSINSTFGSSVLLSSNASNQCKFTALS